MPAKIPQLDDTPQASKESHNSIHNRRTARCSTGQRQLARRRTTLRTTMVANFALSSSSSVGIGSTAAAACALSIVVSSRPALSTAALYEMSGREPPPRHQHRPRRDGITATTDVRTSSRDHVDNQSTSTCRSTHARTQARTTTACNAAYRPAGAARRYAHRRRQFDPQIAPDLRPSARTGPQSAHLRWPAVAKLQAASVPIV